MADYARGSRLNIEKSLKSWGIPQETLDELHVGNGEISYNGQKFASFQCYIDLEEPLFYFEEQMMAHQRFQTIVDGKFKPIFKLTLDEKLKPCFLIQGVQADRHLLKFIEDLREFPYKNIYGELKIEYAPCVKENCSKKQVAKINSKRIKVPFENIKAAKYFIEYLNENYCLRPKKHWDMLQEQA